MQQQAWLKAIWRGNYNTRPLINIKNVNKYFPESEETQQGHMRNQRQGVRSTKIRIKQPAIEDTTTIDQPTTVVLPKSMTFSSGNLQHTRFPVHQSVVLYPVEATNTS